MWVEWLKKMMYALVRCGLSLPETGINRLPEYVQLHKLLQEQAINCVLDVGANQGQTVHLLRGLGFTGPIYSFEPQSRMFEQLTKRYGNDPNWRGFQLALGATSEQTSLHINLNSNEMSSLLPLQNSSMQTRTELVEMTTLDAILPALAAFIDQPRILLNMDTEMYDLQVFHGAKQSLPMIYGLQSEVFVHETFAHAPHYLQSLQAYEKAGFELVNLAFVSRTEHGELMCLNAIMKKGYQ